MDNEMINKKEISEGWKKRRLVKVCKVQGGFAFKSEEFLKDGVPLIKISNINDESVKLEKNNSYISNNRLKFYKSFIIKEGDILIALSGATVGKIGRIKNIKLSLLNQRVGRFMEYSDVISKKYLFYTLLKGEMLKYIINNAASSAQPNISPSFIENFKILFPSSLTEQCKIAEILETVDETIEKTDAIIEKYKRVKQGLMQELLTKGIDENGQIRTEKTHKFKDSPLGSIPEEWEVERIIDAIGVKKNLIIAGPFGSNLKVSDYKKRGIPLIRLQNIEENKFIDKDIKYISKKKAKELYYHSFKNGDVVLAKLGIPVGKTCIIPKNLKFGIVVADVVRIRVIDEYSDKEFITYILNFNTCRKRLNMEIIGTTRPRVNLTQIRSLQLPLPPLPEQKRIASILSQIDETIEKEQNYKEKLKQIKQGLMEDLLTCKVRVLNVN